MRVKSFMFLPIAKRPPADAVAGTVTVLLIVITIVVAIHEMLPK